MADWILWPTCAATGKLPLLKRQDYINQCSITLPYPRRAMIYEWRMKAQRKILPRGNRIRNNTQPVICRLCVYITSLCSY